MSFRNEIKSKPCPNCTTGKIMTGRHAEFNAKSATTGNQICADCKLEEIYGGTIAKEIISRRCG